MPRWIWKMRKLPVNFSNRNGLNSYFWLRPRSVHPCNNTYPVDFLMSNLLIEANICRAAHATKVNRLIFLGSSCIYRAIVAANQRRVLAYRPLETTNRPYALAKIAGIEMCWSYNRHMGRSGWRPCRQSVRTGDNYDLNNSHVLPALIRKMHEGKVSVRAKSYSG